MCISEAITKKKSEEDDGSEKTSAVKQVHRKSRDNCWEVIAVSRGLFRLTLNMPCPHYRVRSTRLWTEEKIKRVFPLLFRSNKAMLDRPVLSEAGLSSVWSPKTVV